MRLRALDLHRVPGIDRHFRIEASTEPGVVNIVTGRNASGKSTLLRVMRGLLYPRQYTDHTWRAAGEFVDEAGHSLTVLNTGGTTSWSDGTHAIAAPSLPEARFAGCYMLEFEDIAGRHAASEEALAQRIARELTGGYDLKAVGELFPAKTSRAKTLASELDKAETERSQVQREHNSLREKENRLDTLQAELASAEATAAQLSAIRDAEAYREARRQLEEIDAQLAAMPEGMGRLTGDDREQLEQIDEALRSARQRETTAADQRQDADQQLAASGLATAALDADALSEPREQCHAIGRAEDQRDQANQLLREQQAALAERTKQLGGATGADPGPVTADDVRSASESLASWREQKNRERQLELALEGLPGDDPATTRTEALREARHALRRWLAAAAAAGTASRQWLDWLALGIPLALASAVAAIQGHPALLGLLLLGAAAVGIRWWRSAPDAPLKTVQAQFNTTGVTPPSSWTRDAVEARLNELETELTTAERHQQLVDTRRETERKLDHQRQALAETEQDLADRAASLGFEPRKMDAGLTAWLETLRAYHEQREHVATTQARLQHLTDDIADRRSRVIAFLTDYGEAPAGDEPASTTLAAALDRLDTRLSQRDNALKALSSADKEIAQAGNERERLTAQRTQFFERRGLADDDEAGLRRRLDRLEDWRTLNSQREQATGRVNLSRQRLLGEDDNPPPFALTLLELADNDDQQGLARHREHAEQASREADRCRNEIAQIRADIRQARNDRRLEAAEAKVQQARDRLDACYTQGLLERAGAFLVDEVEQEVQAIQRPVALAQAQSWFGAFTDDAYELQLLPGDAPAFVARDATTGRDYALSELSSGTRMQLLLAARLGFAVYAEGDRGQLPLFLDHALATTDPERFGAIAKTVQQIAAEQGRQVFYLTADPAEVSRWRHTLGSEAIREIDVAAIRGQADAIADVAALDTAPSPIAAPDEIGEDAFFRQLAIPYVDPWQDSGTIHIAYLLRDNPGLVHRLVAMGMGRAGQLRHFLHRQADTGILDADERQLIRARLAGAAAWVEAWTRGRGLPVDRDSLGSEDSPVNPDRTSKYEAIVAVADAHGHDPQALINALRGREVSNLQKKLIDKLEDYLSEGGYLPTATPLAPEERRQRVAETLSQYMDAAKAGTVAETLTARLDAGVGHAASEADTAPE